MIGTKHPPHGWQELLERCSGLFVFALVAKHIGIYLPTLKCQSVLKAENSLGSLKVVVENLTTFI
jgi:hypothetical protein